jgi:hypothetical protein
MKVSLTLKTWTRVLYWLYSVAQLVTPDTRNVPAQVISSGIPSQYLDYRYDGGKKTNSLSVEGADKKKTSSNTIAASRRSFTRTALSMLTMATPG